MNTAFQAKHPSTTWLYIVSSGVWHNQSTLASTKWGHLMWPKPQVWKLWPVSSAPVGAYVPDLNLQIHHILSFWVSKWCLSLVDPEEISFGYMNPPFRNPRLTWTAPLSHLHQGKKMQIFTRYVVVAMPASGLETSGGQHIDTFGICGGGGRCRTEADYSILSCHKSALWKGGQLPGSWAL